MLVASYIGSHNAKEESLVNLMSRVNTRYTQHNLCVGAKRMHQHTSEIMSTYIYITRMVQKQFATAVVNDYKPVYKNLSELDTAPDGQNGYWFNQLYKQKYLI